MIFIHFIINYKQSRRRKSLNIILLSIIDSAKMKLYYKVKKNTSFIKITTLFALIEIKIKGLITQYRENVMCNNDKHNTFTYY